MKEYRVYIQPFYRDSEGDHCPQNSLKIGDVVQVADGAKPDGVGDVMTETGNYINLSCLAEINVGGIADRVELIQQAKKLLRADADASDVIAMAKYLEGTL